jgi:hypothetical protein
MYIYTCKVCIHAHVLHMCCMYVCTCVVCMYVCMYVSPQYNIGRSLFSNTKTVPPSQSHHQCSASQFQLGFSYTIICIRTYVFAHRDLHFTYVLIGVFIQRLSSFINIIQSVTSCMAVYDGLFKILTTSHNVADSQRCQTHTLLDSLRCQTHNVVRLTTFSATRWNG